MAGDGATSLLGELDSLTRDPNATDDFSKETAEVIDKAEGMAKGGRLDEAVDELLIVEKKARQACDAMSASKLTCKVLSLFRSAEKWQRINEYVVLLTKKRGQLKRAIADMLQQSMKWIDETPNEVVQLELIHTLSAVSEGKIFVEVERARLIRKLAKIKEEAGNIEEATAVLQEVQVETFGAMEQQEKAEYILDQMRLVLLKSDFVRCQIISRKINPKLLEKEEFQDIKVQYHQYMVKYFLNEGKYLDVCKAYHSMLHTPDVLQDKTRWQPLLESYVLYMLLSPFDEEQSSLLKKLKVAERKHIDELPTFKKLVDDFLKAELMDWPLSYEVELKPHRVFAEEPHVGGKERWVLLRKRVVQHNLKVLGQYYNRISMARLSSLLGLSTEEIEMEVAELVCSKIFEAKMDRPSGIITFGRRKEASDRLNDWSSDISKLLNLVEESSHLIQKENMIQAARAKKAQMNARNAA